jgi:hypothetical protein
MIARIVNSISIGQQCSEQTTVLKELMPVATRPSKPTHFDAEDNADVSHRHLCNHALESDPVLDTATAHAKVIVDHFDAGN